TLYRFVRKIRVGDLTVCPDTKTRTTRIGQVSGPYEHRREYPFYRNVRPAEWLTVDVPRAALSLSAQSAISSKTTVFEISTGSEEVAALIDESPSITTEVDFSWVSFYAELADKILTYRSRRQELIAAVFRVGEQSGLPHLFKYLRADQGDD